MNREGEAKYLMAARIVTAGPAGVVLGGTLAIEGSRIAAILTNPVSSSENVFDFGDATILPGIVDAHAHPTLFADGRNYEEMMQEPNELMVLVGLRNLRNHLESGVTTVRDNGGRDRNAFYVRDAIIRGFAIGPRLLVSGRPITHTSGHFHFCHEVADGPDEMTRSVRKLVAEGADHIKIMASGGATAGNQPFYPSYGWTELKAAVDTAHELGRLTTAHCRSRQAMENALKAGLDCIEHVEFLVPRGPHPLGTGRIAEGLNQYDPDLAERLLDSEMFLSFTPQTGGYDSLVRLRSTAKERVLTDTESKELERLEKYYESKLGILANLIRDGFLPRLAISSDAGVFDTEFGRMDFGLELAVAAGMTHLQAIEAVTRVPAEACGIGSTTGSLDVGKEADVLVVRGNPLEDLAAIRDVVAVYLAGTQVTRPPH